METIREEKFQQIIQRRKLVDLAKAQAQEVAFLRSEVERLRMKIFFEKYRVLFGFFLIQDKR